MSVEKDLSGQKLGQYNLIELIGKGGMGMVYRAHQSRANRDVAIKVLSEKHARYEETLRRFEKEARINASLQHPHILPVYDVGNSNGLTYMVMAYMSGATLSHKIAAHPRGIDVPDAVQVTVQIASALDHAHKQGIIHRDLKAGNILLDEQGYAYLSDFGIAHARNSREDRQVPALGTYAYLAPETLLGTDPHPAADIYGLGVVIFEMLAGQRPFPITDYESLVNTYREGAVPNIHAFRPDLPSGINVVLKQALSFDPTARPPHATALAIALTTAARAGLSTVLSGVPRTGGGQVGTPEEDEADLPSAGIEPIIPTTPDLEEYETLMESRTETSFFIDDSYDEEDDLSPEKFGLVKPADSHGDGSTQIAEMVRSATMDDDGFTEVKPQPVDDGSTEMVEVVKSATVDDDGFTEVAKIDKPQPADDGSTEMVEPIKMVYSIGDAFAELSRQAQMSDSSVDDPDTDPYFEPPQAGSASPLPSIVPETIEPLPTEETDPKDDRHGKERLRRGRDEAPDQPEPVPEPIQWLVGMVMVLSLLVIFVVVMMSLGIDPAG